MWEYLSIDNEEAKMAAINFNQKLNNGRMPKYIKLIYEKPSPMSGKHMKRLMKQQKRQDNERKHKAKT